MSRVKNPGTRTGERVLLARMRLGDPVQPAYVDESGRVWAIDCVWTPAYDAEQVARILYARGVPRNASRERVLAELHLAGYWPTAGALDTYLGGAP